MLLTAIVSGFSIFVNSFGIKGFDSSVFTFSKNVVVALFLFSIIILTAQHREIKKLTAKHWKQLITIGFVGGSIPFLLFFKGLQLTTGTTSAFIHKTIFIYIGVFALLFLKEKLTKGFFIGALLLIVGNYFMIRPDFGFSVGHILILIATLFWAAENTYAKHVVKEVSGTLVGFGRMFFGSLFILVFLLFTGKTGIVVSMSSEQYLWIALTSVFLLLYVFTYYNGIKHIKITTAASILTIGAPITTLLHFIVNGKAISLMQAAGMLFIAAGIISIILFSEMSLSSKRVLAVQNERH